MLWTAFTIGLFGSLHCIGMCGPIALALPYQQHSKWLAIWKVFQYNLGRTATYAFLGLLIGLIGEGLFLVGVQRWLSVGLGISLVVVALFSIPVESILLRSSLFGRHFVLLKTRLAKLLQPSDKTSFFKIGLLNGFLPCGMVYLAIVSASTMGSAIGGVLYMLLFGLGTIPLMLATAFAGQLFDIGLRNQLKRLYPAFLLSLAVLLIFRGVQFSVPRGFNLWEAMQVVPMCF